MNNAPSGRIPSRRTISAAAFRLNLKWSYFGCKGRSAVYKMRHANACSWPITDHYWLEVVQSAPLVARYKREMTRQLRRPGP